MKRRVNFTGRKKIGSQNIDINILENDNDEIFFSVDFYLDEFNFPAEAKLYIEAYHKTEFKRFDFGNISNISPPEDRSLTDVGFIDNIKFRIKIVDESKSKGILLGHGDGIKPEKDGDPGETENIKPIITSRYGDIGNRIWKIDYGIDKPCLVFSSDLNGIRNLSKSNSDYFFMIFSSVIKEILNYIIFIERVDLEEPEQEWHKDWLKFAKNLNPEIPDIPDPDNLDNEGEIDEWINDVIKEFGIFNNERWDNLIDKLGGGA